MTKQLRLRPGALLTIRELHRIQSEEAQADMMKVSLSSIRRMDRGEKPSSDFIVALCSTFGYGIGDLFEIVDQSQIENESRYLKLTA